MTPTEHIAYLEKLVKIQAELKELWGPNADLNKLQCALRHIHAVIEKDVVVAKEMGKEYLK